MKNSTLELQDELDSYDVDNSLTAVAAYSELLRTTYIESLETLYLFRDILIGMHQDDEGYQDVKIVMDNKENDIFD